MNRSTRVLRHLPLVAGLAAAAFGGTALTATANAASTTPVSGTQACSPLQIVYARGTTESQNPYGGILGNSLVADMQADVPGTTAYSIVYPASIVEPSSEETGNKDMVSHLEAQEAACPGEKFVVTGYSQGANIVADSFGLNTVKDWVGAPSVAQLPASFASNITAVLTFGPPYNQQNQTLPAPYNSPTILDQFCTVGDIFCSTSPKDGIGGLDIHLQSYQAHLPAAAAFAAANFKAGVIA